MTNFVNAQQIGSKRILFINSYSPDFPTYNLVNKAINENCDGINTIIDIEFLYSKELSSNIYFDNVYKLLKYKIEKRLPYDVVVTIDNNALGFVLKYRDSIFSTIPVIFCGVEDSALIKKATERKGISGITEFCSFEATIDLAKILNPKLTTIIAITDNTETGKVNANLYRKLGGSYQGISLSEIDLCNHTFSDFWQLLGNFSGNKAFLLISAYVDSTGQYLPFENSLNKIVSNSNIPLYHLYYHGFGQGIVGGKLMSHYSMASKALKKAIETPTGILWENKIIVNENPDTFFIDYQVAMMHGLKLNNLPTNSLIINQPVSTLKIEKKYFYLIVTSTILALILVTFLLINIQARKKIAKELLIAKEKAEESDRLKTAFIANMSHEIRTPMNSIVGFSGMLREEGLDSSTRDRYCDIIDKNSMQLLGLINDIIDVAKIESGELTFHPERVLLFDLLNIQVLSFQKKIAKLNKQIDLKLRFELNPKTKITTDPVRMNQLLSNLLSNAVKYTEKGSILVGCKMKDNNFFFYVEDTGIGISEHMQSKLFKRFSREEDVKKLYDGTGLGLSIVKSIVKMWNGEIWVESRKGEGSKFYFTHPTDL